MVYKGNLEIKMQSFIEYIDIKSGSITPLLSSNTRMSAPTWFPDGQTLLSNVYGRIHQFSKADQMLKLVDTQFLGGTFCDYGLSPDGSQLALTNSDDYHNARIYIREMQNGAVRVAVNQSPSWFHGWSRDGRYIIYTCIRKEKWAIGQIAVEGDGKEQILLQSDKFTSKMLDGPEFSPDGRYFWFNSDKSGTMQIWRKELGTDISEQMTDDDDANYFPHPSPDGTHVCFLKKNRAESNWSQDGLVELWLLSLNGSPPKHLRTVFGGLGTLNVPSWSPTGDGFAYARYSQNYDDVAECRACVSTYSRRTYP